MSIYIAHCRKEPPVRCGSGVFARADVVEYLLENTSEGDESKVDLGNNAQTWWSTCWKTRRKATSRRWTSVTTKVERCYMSPRSPTTNNSLLTYWTNATRPNLPSGIIRSETWPQQRFCIIRNGAEWPPDVLMCDQKLLNYGLNHTCVSPWATARWCPTHAAQSAAT